jgi:hypothetical protein
VSLATIIAVTVDVTAGHLASGRPGNCRLCALALAVTDAIEGATGARVFYASADRDPVPDVRADVTLAGGGTLQLALGPDVARIMARIDAGQPVDPFSFVAEVAEALTEESAR